MAGLNLMGSASFGGGGGANLASVPAAAGQLGSGTPSITQRAFGIGTSQTAGGARTAGYGTVGLGIAGSVLLVWLWWTLPR